MSGIIFFKTKELDTLKSFYIDKIGCQLWQEKQGNVVLKNGNFLFGFTQGEEAEVAGALTFFYEKMEEVDHLYETIKEIAVFAPVMNDSHEVYHFFAKDPEGRIVEFQSFD